MKTVVRIKIKSLVKFIIFMPFAFAILLQLIHLPSIIKYTVDFCWIFVLGIMLYSKKNFKDVQIKCLQRWIILYFLYTIVAYVMNFQSIFYYLWGIRNNFRFYVLFFACIRYFSVEDSDLILNLFDKLYFINFFITIIQYFIFGIKQDLLGGIFGNETGANGYTNILIIIVLSKSIIYYLNKKENGIVCISKIISAICIAAMAELKFFYIELVIIIVVASLLTKPSLKKAVIIVVLFLGIYYGLNLIAVIFPSSSGGEYSLLGFIQSGMDSKGYTGSNDLNRLTGIYQINNRFFKSIPRRLFGFGLGNCDSNMSFDFLITPFSKMYSFLHYAWFMLAISYLETGIVGLIFIFGFYVYILISCLYKIVKKDGIKEYCQIAVLIAICSIILCIYNQSMRVESAYMIYFTLALPYIKTRLKKEKIGEE